jgi:hypothetical protein
LGNKVLRQRLKGPALAAYYPRKVSTVLDLMKAYPDLDMINEAEEDRLEKIRMCVLKTADIEFSLITIQCQSQRKGCSQEAADKRGYGSQAGSN